MTRKNLLISLPTAVLTLFSIGALADGPKQVDSAIIEDLVLNSSKLVDIKHSNSSNCKSPCTVEKYLVAHFTQAKELEKERGLPSKLTFDGHCKELKDKPGYLDLNPQLKWPGKDKVLECTFKFSCSGGEVLWSEDLMYWKDIKTQRPIEHSFWAMGTP